MTREDYDVVMEAIAEAVLAVPVKFATSYDRTNCANLVRRDVAARLIELGLVEPPVTHGEYPR